MTPISDFDARYGRIWLQHGEAAKEVVCVVMVEGHGRWLRARVNDARVTFDEALVEEPLRLTIAERGCWRAAESALPQFARMAVPEIPEVAVTLLSPQEELAEPDPPAQEPSWLRRWLRFSGRLLGGGSA